MESKFDAGGCPPESPCCGAPLQTGDDDYDHEDSLFFPIDADPDWDVADALAPHSGSGERHGSDDIEDEAEDHNEPDRRCPPEDPCCSATCPPVQPFCCLDTARLPVLETDNDYDYDLGDSQVSSGRFSGSGSTDTQDAARFGAWFSQPYIFLLAAIPWHAVRMPYNHIKLINTIVFLLSLQEMHRQILVAQLTDQLLMST